VELSTGIALAGAEGPMGQDKSPPPDGGCTGPVEDALPLEGRPPSGVAPERAGSPS